jgi:Rab3 GTPase-activating protein catalytic subunit
MQSAQSLVSRARTAIHTAAARVLTDIKADLQGTCAVVRGPRARCSLPLPNLMSSRAGGVVGSVVVGGTDAEGFGGRSRALSPRMSLDREAAEASATGREPDVKPSSPRDEVRGCCRSTPPTGCCSIQSGARAGWW